MDDRERVALSRVEATFERLDYPVTRDDAAAEFVDVTLTFADGEANLGALVSELGSDAFHDPEELSAELRDVLPVEAAGEPSQSDGDA